MNKEMVQEGELGAHLCIVFLEDFLNTTADILE